jgi:hypothetical protein
LKVRARAGRWTALRCAALVLLGAPAARAETETVGPPPRVTPRLLIQGDSVVLHHGPNAPTIEDGTTRPGFYLRSARVGIDVSDGDWGARLIAEPTARPEVVDTALDPIAGELARGRPRATEAYVAYAPHKAFALAMGALRVPLGLSRRIDEGDLSLPERGRIITRATPDFRMGAAASGDLGLLQYALGTYAAAPVYGSDFRNGGALTVLHLNAEPVGPVGVAPQLRRRDDPWYGWWRFAVGVSAFYAALPGANEFGLGGDGQFQWRRFRFAGEMLWTRRTDADRIGFTLEPGLFVLPDRVEVVARAEWLNDQVGPRSAVDGWGAALGATLYTASRRARLQAAYTMRRGELGPDAWSSWAVVRATFTL